MSILVLVKELTNIALRCTHLTHLRQVGIIAALGKHLVRLLLAGVAHASHVLLGLVLGLRHAVEAWHTSLLWLFGLLSKSLRLAVLLALDRCLHWVPLVLRLLVLLLVPGVEIRDVLVLCCGCAHLVC